MTQSLAQMKSSSKTISSIEIYFCMSSYFWKHEEKVLDLQHGKYLHVIPPTKYSGKSKKAFVYVTEHLLTKSWLSC